MREGRYLEVVCLIFVWVGSILSIVAIFNRYDLGMASIGIIFLIVGLTISVSRRRMGQKKKPNL